MKTCLKFLLLLLTAWIPPAFGMTPQQALAGNYIQMSAKSSSSFTEATVSIRNLTSVSVDIDFSSCFFVQSNSSQRIGFAYEYSTGSYNLRLPGGYNSTLTFSSRCLDHNRPVPVTGESYTACYTISSEFSLIVTALRNNASQADVWNITDNSSLTAAWKAADARGPYYSGGYGGGGGGGGGGGYSGGGNDSADINFSGTCGWSISKNRITIKANKISNDSSNVTSGSLRLRVWATRSRYTGSSISGYILGNRNLDTLSPNYYYSKVNSRVAYKKPPKGRYYTTVTIEEYGYSGWAIADYVTMSGKTKF